MIEALHSHLTTLDLFMVAALMIIAVLLGWTLRGDFGPDPMRQLEAWKQEGIEAHNAGVGWGGNPYGMGSPRENHTAYNMWQAGYVVAGGHAQMTARRRPVDNRMFERGDWKG
jgi:hypothetical protein